MEEKDKINEDIIYAVREKRRNEERPKSKWYKKKEEVKVTAKVNEY